MEFYRNKISNLCLNNTNNKCHLSFFHKLSSKNYFVLYNLLLDNCTIRNLCVSYTRYERERVNSGAQPGFVSRGQQLIGTTKMLLFFKSRN